MRLMLTGVLMIISFAGAAQSTRVEGSTDAPSATMSPGSINGNKNVANETKAKRKKSTTHKSKSTINKPCIQAFYANHCLMPDSAYSPYLYYQVYDWVGTRYKYSGSSKKGIDCSGFVSEMYKNTYCIELNGSSGSIYTQVKPIDKNELQEGDILFFKIKRNQISHVGVYLGNNKFAHASVHSGVTVSDLEEQYYKKHFYKGGRLTE